MSWESVIKTIHAGLKPYLKLLRKVTDEDVVRLTEIKSKESQKFDSLKADEDIIKLQEQIDQIKYHLDNLTPYAIDYFKILRRNTDSKEREKQKLEHLTI